jgi:hypothetical protein
MRPASPRLAITLLAAALSSSAFAQVAVDPAGLRAQREGDALFPRAGEFSATVATGVPYLAIGEVAYGVSERFALGVVGGVTPITYGFGLRLRGIVVGGETARLVAVMPVLYYPATASLGHEPWVLAMPQVLAEQRFGGDLTAHVGVGAAAATCTGAIAGLFTGKHEHDADGGFMGGLWNTATVGGALPLGGVTAFADATLILDGVRLADSRWIGGPPLVVTLGVRRGF